MIWIKNVAARKTPLLITGDQSKHCLHPASQLPFSWTGNTRSNKLFCFRPPCWLLHALLLALLVSLFPSTFQMSTMRTKIALHLLVFSFLPFSLSCPCDSVLISSTGSFVLSRSLMISQNLRRSSGSPSTGEGWNPNKTCAQKTFSAVDWKLAVSTYSCLHFWSYTFTQQNVDIIKTQISLPRLSVSSP